MNIIHLSFDHPDQINPNKTKAVKNLYSSLKNETHIVFSLNRSSRILDNFKPVEEVHGFSMRIFGLPYGIMLHLWMFLGYIRIKEMIRYAGLKPDLIHAHKLTFEGIIAYYLAKELGIPYILTVRGNTDLKVIGFRRLYRALYRRVLYGSSAILFLAPWTIQCLLQYYPSNLFRTKTQIVPNIVGLHKGKLDVSPENKRFVTVFHLKSLRIKNIKRVIMAFDQILDQYPGLGLDIIGSGPEENLIRSYISKSKFSERYAMLGHLDNQELVRKLPQYMGFVLPSYPETFGIVFIEALSAGIPIIYSQNSGIDGYFESYLVGEKVNHRSVLQIRFAIERVIQRNKNYRLEIKRLIASGELDVFSSENVGKHYSTIIGKSVVPT